MWTDVGAFLAAARAAQEQQTPQAYGDALRLYPRDPGPDDQDKQWASAPRQWLRRLRVTLLVELARVQEQAGELGAAIATVQQAVASDPLHEEAQGLLMRLLVQTGQGHLVLRHYRALRAAVQREWEAEPNAHRQALE